MVTYPTPLALNVEPVGATFKDWWKWTIWRREAEDIVRRQHKKGELLMLRTFTIELRVDYDDPAKDEVLKEAAMTAAKHLVTTAMLISDKRKPQIALHSSDFFAGTEEINLAADIPSSVE